MHQAHQGLGRQGAAGRGDGGGVGTGGTITVDHGEMGTAVGSFRDVAAAFRGAAEPLGAAEQDAAAGAGQFAGHLTGGVATFSARWAEAFEVCATSAQLVAANIGRTAADVSRVDVEAGSVVVL